MPRPVEARCEAEKVPDDVEAVVRLVLVVMGVLGMV
jgi:hypothetical protein